MGRINWQESIVIAPDLHHDDPCVKGTRVPVATVLGSLVDGMTAGEIVNEETWIVTNVTIEVSCNFSSLYDSPASISSRSVFTRLKIAVM
jgi:hypothetical protein